MADPNAIFNTLSALSPKFAPVDGTTSGVSRSAQTGGVGLGALAQLLGSSGGVAGYMVPNMGPFGLPNPQTQAKIFADGWHRTS